MNIWIRFGYAIAISVVGVMGAGAADIPVSAPPVDAALPYFRAQPLRFFSWTGCYLGGHVGGAWANNEITGTFLGPASGPFGIPTFFTVADTLPISFGSNGFLIGGQGGCNLEFTNRLVIGFEADASWANASGGSRQTLAGSFPGPLFGLPTTANSDGTLSTKIDFIATATGRLGYAFGSIGQGIIYGKGGAAWIANRYSLTGQLQSVVCVDAVFVPPAPPQCLASSTFVTPFNWTSRETRIGWTIGAGVEWAMWGNWTIKGEYDYLDFGTRTVTLNDPVLGPTNASVRQTVSEVKFGVNYRFFGAPLAPSY